MGPTAICIIADQFRKIKDGDRFFYDIGNQPHSFTPGKYIQVLLQVTKKINVKLHFLLRSIKSTASVKLRSTYL